MPRNSAHQPPRPAQVEDYDTDKGKVIPGTAKSANASPPRRAPQAPPVTKATKVTRTGGPDTASESGSSSRTAATMNSADSARELKGEPAKKDTKKKKVVVQEQPQPDPADTRRSRRDSARQQPSPTKAPSRTASQRRKSQHVQCTGCDDPNCPDAIKPSSRRSALDTGVDIDYPPFNVQPTPQARARSSSRPRPQSVYEAYYSSRSGVGPRGPPPSNSAYTNYRQSYYPGSTAQSASYFPSATSTVRSSTVHSRPPLQTSNTEPTYSARRPSSGLFEAPVISYGPPGPSARHAEPYPSQNPRDSGIVYYDADAEAATHRLSSSGFPTRRSSLRHSYNLPAPTPANEYEYAVEDYADDDDYPAEYAEEYRLSRPTTLQRTPSQRRSSLAPPPPTFARAQPPYPDTPDQEAAAAAEYYQQETNRRARRRAADVHPQPYDPNPAPAPRATVAPGGGPSLSRPDPAPRRRTSSRAPSERSARTAVSGSSRVSTQADGSIRVRVDASRGIEFSGNMEGRSINVTGAQDGMADVVISTGGGDGRRGDTVYGGSRASGGGSTRGSGGGRSERGGVAASMGPPPVPGGQGIGQGQGQGLMAGMGRRRY
ncbi:MAG: hypothetical protein Q9165_007373 [Trypethelium subeluteriae]